MKALDYIGVLGLVFGMSACAVESLELPNQYAEEGISNIAVQDVVQGVRDGLIALESLDLSLQLALEEIWIEQIRGDALSPLEQRKLRKVIERSRQSSKTPRVWMMHATYLTRLVGPRNITALLETIIRRMDNRYWLTGSSGLSSKPMRSQLSTQEYDFWVRYLQKQSSLAAAKTVTSDSCATIGIDEEIETYPYSETLYQYNFGYNTGAGDDKNRITLNVNIASPVGPAEIEYETRKARIVSQSEGRETGKGLICHVMYQLSTCLASKGIQQATYSGSTATWYIHQKQLNQGWVNEAWDELTAGVHDDPAYRFVAPVFGFRCVDRLTGLAEGNPPNRLWYVDRTEHGVINLAE